MNEFFSKVVTWIKENKMLAAAGGLLVLLLLFPRLVRKLMGTTRRRRRSLPRSVGMRRYSRSRRSYSKGGRAKKPWQIKGSPAARRHMAQIRKKRA
jgi:hypothetical protein